MNEEDMTRTVRERFDAAREAYERAREAARQARSAERAAEREARQLAREAARDARDAVREHRHRITHDVREMGFGPGRLNLELSELGDLIGGQEYSETVEKTFSVGSRPSLLVRNVSGYTHVTVGQSGEIAVRARKRVRGTSEERAKRLLQNVEVRMGADGDEVSVKPHLYEQDRGWLDLFRGGRVAVDIDIAVPRDVRIEAHSVSGDLSVTGTRGSLEIQTTSGDASVDDVQGPLRIKTVSGDGVCRRVVGQLDANSVSGDLTFSECRVRGSEVVSVSGDVEIDGELAPGFEHYAKTISGDIVLGLAGDSFDIMFKTLSGDLDCDLEATIEREDRRDRRVKIGAGEVAVRVKTVSGDLQLRRARALSTTPATDAPKTAEPPAPPSDPTSPAAPMSAAAPTPPAMPIPPGGWVSAPPGAPMAPMDGPAAAVAEGSASPALEAPETAAPPRAGEASDATEAVAAFDDTVELPGEFARGSHDPERTEQQERPRDAPDVRGLLELVARGEIAVEDAAQALDAARAYRKPD